MNTRQPFRIAASALFLGLFVAHAHASTDPAPDAARITQLKAEAKQLRGEAETSFETIEPACYEKFMVNRCIDQAKQDRLTTIRRARALEAEARKLELAQRQRNAAEVMRGNPGAPQSATSPSPANEAVVAPAAEAEALRAERAQAAIEAESGARTLLAARDAERAVERNQAHEAATQRAEQAARDRARYEERIREYEAKKARDADGR